VNVLPVETHMRAYKVIRDPKGFDVIGDKTRRRIIYLLRVRERSVSQIADELDVTPQAIYHHIRKLLDIGLVEVAKEERIGHFIETYYRATAEVFEFKYGESESQNPSEAATKDAFQALERVGLVLKVDDETISRYVKLMTRIESFGARTETEEKIAAMEDIDLLSSQHAGKIIRTLSMTDKQFDEMQTLEKDVRDLLKSRLIEQKEVTAKQTKTSH